jgi:CspA family cold shock protein
MATGRVKWFNNAKGYGFILPDNGESDLFAHYTSIEMDGYKTLKAGQVVTFNTIKGDKGHHAVNIVPEISHTSAPVSNNDELTKSRLVDHLESV